MRDEKNHHDAVDEPSLKQQFHESNTITFIVWSHTLGCYGRSAVWQIGVR